MASNPDEKKPFEIFLKNDFETFKTKELAKFQRRHNLMVSKIDRMYAILQKRVFDLHFINRPSKQLSRNQIHEVHSLIKDGATDFEPILEILEEYLLIEINRFVIYCATIDCYAELELIKEMDHGYFSIVACSNHASQITLNPSINIIYSQTYLKNYHQLTVFVIKKE